ncbi:MAG: GDSL-type esterase/lipase family protein [Alphaproteobacteria bacterium]
MILTVALLMVGCTTVSATRQPVGSQPKTTLPTPELLVLGGLQPLRPERPRTPLPGLPPGAAPLAPLFEALRDIDSGAAKAPVTIMHIGDNHTAGDRFSGRLRELFQERFGAAGRGMMPPGVPFKSYRPSQASVEATEGWTITNSVEANAAGPFGISGFRLRGTSPADSISLRSDDPQGFDLLEIEVLMQPGGGDFRVTVDDGTPGTLQTRNGHVQVGILKLPVGPGARKVVLSPVGNGPAEFLSWTVQRTGRAGIVYDSHGVIGATIDLPGRWDPNIVAWELSHRDPALIVVSFGTNEGLRDDLRRDRYVTAFAQRLDALRRAAPRAAILVVGPPDANRLPPACYKSARALVQYPCDPEDKAGAGKAKGKDKDKGASANCRWSVPPSLSLAREAQRKVAAERGYYFWDWSKVMDGQCGTHQWTLKTPPLAYGDHVHLQAEGYMLSADILFNELMALYARANPTPTRP